MTSFKNLIKNYQKVNRYKDELMTSSGFNQLPVVSKPSMAIAGEIANANNLMSVLDIGANNCRFKNYLSPFQGHYYSLDPDTSYAHNFRDLKDVKDNLKFDMITLFAVIEHMEKRRFIDEYIPFFIKHLMPDGYLIISSSNIFHNLGIRTDYSHVTSYSPRDLHAIMRNFNFDTKHVFRISLIPRKFRWFFDLLNKTLLKPYCLDYAPEICWIFTKNKE